MRHGNIEPERRDMGITLKMARVGKGLTQTEAARQIGVTDTTLRKYEKGKSFPDVPTIKKIEALYGVTYDQLIFVPSEYGLTVTK